MARGYSRWLTTNSEDDVKEFKRVFKTRLREGSEVWIAILKGVVVGYLILANWIVLPEAKVIEAFEVARPYRGMGIGSKLLSRVLEEYSDRIVGLLLYPEPGYEDRLREFYRNFGFIDLGGSTMIKFPDKVDEKVLGLLRYLRDLRDLYDLLLKAFEERVSGRG